MKVTMIDLPEGWLYGFPRIIPKWVKAEEVDQWIIEVGYPRSVRDDIPVIKTIWTKDVGMCDLPEDYFERKSI